MMRASDLRLQYNAVQILEHNLTERADKVALYSKERALTFRQASDEVNRIGNALKRLDVRMGESVAILNLDNAEWALAYFAILKIGAVAVGMNTLLKPHEHAYILNDARARVLIAHASLLPAIEAVRDEIPFVEHVVVVGEGERSGEVGERNRAGLSPSVRSLQEDAAGERSGVRSLHGAAEAERSGGVAERNRAGLSPSVRSLRRYEDWIGEEATTLEAAATHRDDFCALNYSSGTTGEPKGILHAHKDLPLTAQLWAVNVLGLRESDRTFATAKLFFTFGTGGNLVFPWYVGASCVLMAAPPRIAANVLEMIDTFKPTIHFNAPTGYAALLATPDLEKYDLSSLRLCVSAGEALPAPIWQAWKEKTGLDIIDGIGCTEVWHIFISNAPHDIRPGSSGKPVPGMDARIVDENLNDVPPGEVGNLMVRSETTALSYLHQSDKSRRTFIGEWMLTGDKYFTDEDGYYWHAGRSDDMLKVGGIFVSPVEVESTLMSHPAVLECAVVGVPDASNLIKPVAYVVLKDGYIAGEELSAELIGYCKEKMAEYKRPRRIGFVNELPKTATGKIQRFRLRTEERRERSP